MSQKDTIPRLGACFLLSSSIFVLWFSRSSVFHLKYQSGICEEDAETAVKCELTIDNGEAVQQCLAIKPVVVLCVSNFKHPRTIAEQPARQPGRNTAWTGGRSCYLSHAMRHCKKAWVTLTIFWSPHELQFFCAHDHMKFTKCL